MAEAIKLEEKLAEMREELSPLLVRVQTLADDRPRSGAEIMLALRHLQDARMRLGVAEALEKGLNPWENRIK